LGRKKDKFGQNVVDSNVCLNYFFKKEKEINTKKYILKFIKEVLEV